MKVDYLDADNSPIGVLTQEIDVQILEGGATTLLTYSPGTRAGSGQRITGWLEDLLRRVPDGRSFPQNTTAFQTPSEAVWEAVVAALMRREKGVQADKLTGLVTTEVARHGIIGLPPLYRQYLVEVRPQSQNATELHFVQLLYRRQLPRDPNAPVSQSSIWEAKEGRGRSDLGQLVTGAEQPAFQNMSGMYKRDLDPRDQEREKKAFLKAVQENIGRP